MIRSSAPFELRCDRHEPHRAVAAGHEVVELGDRRRAQRWDELGPALERAIQGPSKLESEHDGPRAFMARMSGAQISGSRSPRGAVATAATPSTAVLKASGLSDTVVASRAVVPCLA